MISVSCSKQCNSHTLAGNLGRRACQSSIPSCDHTTPRPPPRSLGLLLFFFFCHKEEEQRKRQKERESEQSDTNRRKSFVCKEAWVSDSQRRCHKDLLPSMEDDKTLGCIELGDTERQKCTWKRLLFCGGQEER